MNIQDYEKLGSFYLGRLLDESKHATGELLLYDAKDLVTHAVCIGMTGSGKTGLCIGLLEEAAIDSIPALVIDPKGDIGNLLLTFPEMRPEDFRPWIDEQETVRNGLDPDSYAAKLAETCRTQLAESRQPLSRIQALHAATDLAIYTPGSNAGLSLNILRSFSAPDDSERLDEEAIRDRIMTSVSGLLAMIGINADPVQSREHILISNILNQAWKEGRDLSVADIIRAVMSPPFATLGVFDVETFYPEKDRKNLAMQLNNVLAAPSFASWMDGEPLDIQRLLYTKNGRPRISIMSIAHLSDNERMFFVTLFLNELISWMRKQTGTGSLRAILYMDEIYGYFPPSASPPSKTPMLTLLKQARAYGLGCLLATQNPVDLDYKGLGNTGTWFIGRLQTERDKLRLLDGLENVLTSAGQSFNRSTIDTLLSSLGKRVFLMNNVHDDGPVLFETRWVLSYLRGPLTRTEIEALMRERKTTTTETVEYASAKVYANENRYSDSGSALSDAIPSAMEVIPGAPEIHFPIPSAVHTPSAIIYKPMLYATAQLHYVHAKSGMDKWETYVLLATLPSSTCHTDWNETALLRSIPTFIEGPPEAQYPAEALPETAANKNHYPAWKKSLIEWAYQHITQIAWQCPELKLTSFTGEDEGAFRVRIGQTFREQRDEAMKKLRARYEQWYNRAHEKIRKAELRVQQQESTYKTQQMSAVVDIGTTLLGAFLGRRSVPSLLSGRGASAVNKASRTMQKRADIDRRYDDVAAAKEELLALDAKFKAETTDLQLRFASAPEVEIIIIKPRKSELSMSDPLLAWVPWSEPQDGMGPLV